MTSMRRATGKWFWLALQKQGETNRELAARLDDLAVDPRLWDKGRAKRSHGLRAAGEHTSSGCLGMGEGKKTQNQHRGRSTGRWLHPVRKQNTEGASSQANKKFPDSPTQCWFCQRYGKPGHEARDCRIMVKQMEGKEDTGKKLEKPKRDLKDI